MARPKEYHGPRGPALPATARCEPNGAEAERLGTALVALRLERFFDKIETRGECWYWTSGTNADGYGTWWDGVRYWGAHRWSYSMFVGDIPEEYVIDHLCRNPRCVNPRHLEAVTGRENLRRGARPGPKPNDFGGIKLVDPEKWARAKKRMGL